MSNIQKLISLSNRRERLNFFILILMSCFMSILELFTIGAVIPFVGVLINPEMLLENKNASFILSALYIKDVKSLQNTAIFTFGGLAIGTAIFRLYYIYLSSKFSFTIGSRLSSRMLLNVLNLDYEDFLKNNSSEYINTIFNKSAYLMNNIILGFIQVIGSSIIIIVISGSLIWYNPAVSSSLIFSIGSVYLLISIISKSYLKQFSKSLSDMSDHSIQLIQESLASFRDIKIADNSQMYSENYWSVDHKFRVAQSLSIFVTQAPRYIIEGIALFSFSCVIYFLVVVRDEPVIELLPFIAALAISAQRLLPIVQQLYNSLANFRVYKQPFNDCICLLGQASTDVSDNVLDFTEEVQFKNVSFSYQNGKRALSNLNIIIYKGDKVGVIGDTGCGKSTFIDVFMGLLLSSDGDILVDNVRLDTANRKNWYKRISHVPQSIFLLEASIKDNIVMEPSIEIFDAQRLAKIIQICCLESVVGNFDDGIDAMVGERGSNLSGGQIQRIGIARALYRNTEIIVFDEATSALDTGTEAMITKNIENAFPEITLIHVSHRYQSLKNCNKILRFENGEVSGILSPGELI